MKRRGNNLYTDLVGKLHGNNIHLWEDNVKHVSRKWRKNEINQRIKLTDEFLC
jgi:hypothetical protein